MSATNQQSGFGQHFGFFLENAWQNAAAEELREKGASAGRQPGRPGLDWLEMPASGFAYLAAAPGKPPQLLADPPDDDTQVSVLETVRHELQTYLMMIPGHQVRINGSPAPSVSILRVKDQLRLDDQWLLHVSRHTRPYLGPPPEPCVGQQCSYCRFEFTASTLVYICPHCGSAFHCEDDRSFSNAEVGPLECARLVSECHHCHGPLLLEERYEYVPEP